MRPLYTLTFLLAGTQALPLALPTPPTIEANKSIKDIQHDVGKAFSDIIHGIVDWALGHGQETQDQDAAKRKKAQDQETEKKKEDEKKQAHDEQESRRVEEKEERLRKEQEKKKTEE